MSDKLTCEELEQRVREFEQANAECKKTEALLATRVSLESIISKASRRFLALTEMDKSINTCLVDVGHLCVAERAYLFQFASDGATMNNTHEWCAPGIRPEIENLQELSIDMFPWWMEKLKAGRNIHVKNVAEMPPEARSEKEILEAQNIKSVLVVPFLVESRLAGFLGLDNVASTRDWGEKDLAAIRTLAEIIGTAVTRKRAEEALQKSEEHISSIFRSAPVGIGSVVNRVLNKVNHRLCEITGYDEEELVNQSARILYPSDEDFEFVGREKYAQIADHGTGTVETRWLRKDGVIIDVLLSSTPVDLQDLSKPVTFTALDITERKRTEEERERLQVQFQQAQKMEAIGTLAGGIAHNFNNILMGIQGRASLMMIGMDPSHPDYEKLQGITESVKSATELTRDLLGFARGGKYEPKNTDLNELIRNENRIFGRMNKELQIHTKYENELWPVEVDRGQIQQTLLNLYVNAWQAMPGGGDLYIQTENVIFNEPLNRTFEIEAGRYIKITVTDTGTGMDDATRKRIFEPFFSTKNKNIGSGLGLASAYGIVKNHGGFIDVYSRTGKGTTFTIYFPASAKEPVIDSPDLVLDQPDIQYGKGSILLVDDEDDILDVGKNMLESIGYHILIAQSGKEALDIYQKNKDKIDLVILDMIMPDIGGGEIYDRMKNIDQEVNVLLSSGYSIDGEAKKILSRGCNGFIQKPYSLMDLSIKVRQTLEGNKRGG